MNAQQQEQLPPPPRQRRSKRVKQDAWTSDTAFSLPTRNVTNTQQQQQQPIQALTTTTARKKRASPALQKHGADAASSGGIQALFPSLLGVLILAYGVMAKMGFRGRATVAGIDLGTTNSVLCVQAPAKGVGVIDCIADRSGNGGGNGHGGSSPIVPSVISFLEPSTRSVGPKSKTPSLLTPHPSAVVVGNEAKKRIDSHPHSTLYNAKRVLGRSSNDPAIRQLQEEVEFQLVPKSNQAINNPKNNDNDDEDDGIVFQVPYDNKDGYLSIPPEQVGAYIVTHLLQMTQQFLGHDNVKQAVICVPAKFNARQRQQTIRAFQLAGVTVLRTLEEPTAAALAYGLHRKEGVDYILVYDFGGGTLDVSLLQVSQDGYVDVLGSDGDDRLGGADFDAAVAHYWLEPPQSGQAMVDQVSRALHKLMVPPHQPPPPSSDKNAAKSAQSATSRTLSSSSSFTDLEQRLAQSCPALATTPLCTASSFHTLAEQVKIRLSSLQHEQPNEPGSFTTNYDHTQDPSQVMAEATCLGLQLDKEEDDHSHDSLNVSSFCQRLEPMTLTLTLEEFNHAVQPLLDRALQPVHRLLTEQLDVQQDEIDEVVLVGGTTRMPQIRDLVRSALPSASLNTHIDPDLTVAYGAASVID
ncbi:hypothetical protein ACA910_018745 [Epithemia clementina (nom. ined.)]